MNIRKYGWQRQLHLSEVPFYYIEYGIAQIGRNWYVDAIQRKIKHTLWIIIVSYALSLGGTKTLPQLYRNSRIKV